jgi:hypothetical protein
VWQTLGEQRVLVSRFDEVNKRRVEQGFAPYDEYILVFPVESGIDPLYFMFNDRAEQMI